VFCLSAAGVTQRHLGIFDNENSVKKSLGVRDETSLLIRFTTCRLVPKEKRREGLKQRSFKDQLAFGPFFFLGFKGTRLKLSLGTFGVSLWISQKCCFFSKA